MFENDDDIHTITQAGAMFLIFLFMVLVLYFVLSAPLNSFFTSFLAGSYGEADNEVALFVPYFQAALNLAFVIAIATPATWFIFWVFSREPDYSRYRRF